MISDAHAGLKRAIAEVFVGAAWQRCRVHFMRNLLARVPKKAQAMVAAAVRPIFQQADRTAAQRQLREVCTALGGQFPHAVALLEEAEEEIFTFYDFPAEHRRQIYSTNPLERLNKELKRRSAVVGIFPNRAAVIRLLGALLMEQNDEWLVGRHYFSETSMHKVLHPPPGTPVPPALAVAELSTLLGLLETRVHAVQVLDETLTFLELEAALPEDAEELKDIAKGPGSVADKAKRAGDALKDPGAKGPDAPASPGSPATDTPAPEADAADDADPGTRKRGDSRWRCGHGS